MTTWVTGALLASDELKSRPCGQSQQLAERLTEAVACDGDLHVACAGRHGLGVRLLGDVVCAGSRERCKQRIHQHLMRCAHLRHADQPAQLVDGLVTWRVAAGVLNDTYQFTEGRLQTAGQGLEIAEQFVEPVLATDLVVHAVAFGVERQACHVTHVIGAGSE